MNLGATHLNLTGSMTDTLPPKTTSRLATMDRRSRDIFDAIVRTYLETGEPVGSRTISRSGVSLSPASIRNVMSDLAEMGLLDSPHISAGRLPTQTGLRLFVDGLMEVGKLAPPPADMQRIQDSMTKMRGESPEDMLGEASEILSGLAGGAGLVTSPKRDAAVTHVEFLPVNQNQALAIIVTQDGDVENRLLNLPPGLPVSALTEARNFLNARMVGQTLAQAREMVRKELESNQAALDAAASQLVADGFAQWTGEDPMRGRSLIVRGRANLIDEKNQSENVDRVRQLFEELDRKENLLQVLVEAQEADGVRLFIGEENPLFSLTGSSTIVAPYMNGDRKVIGALGVIGPTRLDYARVIPMVDYTARILGQLLEGRPMTVGKDD